MCPPVPVEVLYALWADTQVRPYRGLHEPLANSQQLEQQQAECHKRHTPDEPVECRMMVTKPLRSRE